MKITLSINVQFEEVEKKSRDNVIFCLTIVLQDLVSMRNKSDFNVEVLIGDIKIKPPEKEEFPFKHSSQLLPICLN